MRARTVCGWIAIAGALLACGGCGFKGPLYLPERNATVVTHPAQSAQPAPAPQGAPPAAQTQTPGAKSKGKTAAPSSEPPNSPPQSPPPPQ